MIRKICLFSGSRSGNRTEYTAASCELGRLLVGKGITAVFGGGKIGLMGAVADEVLAGGGAIIGVIPRAMMPWEVAHEKVTELIVVDSMHERKAKMHELSDAFIALPGGIGTFEEFFEVLSWLSLGFHAKPVGLLNVAGYYDRLLSFLDYGVKEGFIDPAHLAMLISSSSPAQLLERMSV